MYDGHEHTEGSSWFADSNDCMNCMCAGGVTTCSEIRCLSPCVNTIRVAGECCPVCAGEELHPVFVYSKPALVGALSPHRSHT